MGGYHVSFCTQALDSPRTTREKIYHLTLFQLSPNMKNSSGLDSQHFFRHLEQRLLELSQLLLPLRCVKLRFLKGAQGHLVLGESKLNNCPLE